MSDETARQIEYLIEVTQQDIPLKASLLGDVVEGEILVSELLQDIKLDVADIKLGLFAFFEEEQLRFKIQQNQDKEANFRRLEELRELSRGLTTGNVVGGESGTRGAAGDGGAGGAGAVAGNVAAGFAGRTANLLLRRVPQLALIAAAVSGVVDYMGSRPEILEQLRSEGLEGTDLNTEATTQTLAKVMSDFSDNVVEPVYESIRVIAAKEFGASNEEVEKLREEISELSDVFARSTTDLVDMFSAFFGRESSRAALREEQEQINELQQEINQFQQESTNAGLMTPEGQLTDEAAQGLSRLEEISARQEEMRSLPEASTSEESRERAGEVGRLREEERQLRVKLAPVLRQQELDQQRRELENITQLSQAGYEAGDLQTTAQADFGELTSEEKSEFIKKQISPLIKAAEEAGAIDVNEALLISNLPGATMSGGVAGVPLSIDNLDALENLSPQIIEALLVNDDILNNATLQVGALETSDRKIIEYLYRMKTEGAVDPRAQLTPNQVPQLDAGGTIEPGQVAVVGEKGPELVLGPAEVVGREDTAEILSGSSESSSMLAGPLAAQVNQTTVQQPVPVIVTNVETAALSITPSPTISAAVPVNEMSSNMLAMSSAPVIISTTQGGSSVTNMVNNNSTNVIGGGPPARSSDVGHRRYQDRMQGVV
jgi:hypothetical protein